MVSEYAAGLCLVKGRKQPSETQRRQTGSELAAPGLSLAGNLSPYL
jgi:hypothetical protein